MKLTRTPVVEQQLIQMEAPLSTMTQKVSNLIIISSFLRTHYNSYNSYSVASIIQTRIHPRIVFVVMLLYSLADRFA